MWIAKLYQFIHENDNNCLSLSSVKLYDKTTNGNGMNGNNNNSAAIQIQQQSEKLCRSRISKTKKPC